MTLTEARSLRAVVASRHSTPAERAAAQAKLDAPKARPADPYSDDVRQPSEAEKSAMRALLGALPGDPPSVPAPPTPPPAQVPKKPAVPARVVHKPDTAPIVPDDPAELARNQALTDRHARMRAQAAGLQLIHQVRIPDRNTLLLLQPSDQAELDDIWARQKSATIECVARRRHRPERCDCLEITYDFYRDLQLRHDPESPLLLGALHMLVPAAERFAREYKLPATDDADPGKDWAQFWVDLYDRHRRD